MSDSESDKMKYQALLEEYLEAREWEDELSVDEENRAVQLNTGVTIAGQSGRLIIEAFDRLEIVDVYFYYSSVTCRESKFDEMLKLLNSIHMRTRYGRFELLDDGTVRWFQRVDFEGSSPTIQSLNQMVQPGWDVVGKWAEAVAAVALTKQTAAQALEEHDEAQNAREAPAEDDDEGPTEL